MLELVARAYANVLIFLDSYRSRDDRDCRVGNRCVRCFKQVGLSTWKEQLRAKANSELARRVLLNVYKVRDSDASNPPR